MASEVRSEALIRAMTVADLSGVVAIEQQRYTHPWSRGNFVDSLSVGHEMTVIEQAGTLHGYTVSMVAVDELHLLNITVAPASEGQGYARRLLDALRQRAQALQLVTLWLEVRWSNLHARAVYAHYGFRPVAVRKGYYPLDTRRREDALVMSLPLDDAEPQATGPGGIADERP